MRRMLTTLILIICTACASLPPKPINTLEAIAETEAAIAVAARTTTALLDAGTLSLQQAERIHDQLLTAYEILRVARSAVSGVRAMKVIEARALLDSAQSDIDRAQRNDTNEVDSRRDGVEIIYVS